MTKRPSQYARQEFREKMSSQISIQFPDLEDVLRYVAGEFQPDDVFSDDQLEDWAERNGFSKEGAL